MMRTTARAAVITAGLAAVLPLGLATTAASAAPSSAPAAWGSNHSTSHVLRSGCHDYRFHYTVHTPSADWMAELRLVGPKGRQVASHSFWQGADPTTGWSTWRVCSDLNHPGTYTVGMKVTSIDDGTDDATVQVERRTHFRFTPAAEGRR